MRVLTVANQLTFLRILLILLFVLMMLYDYPGAALLVFIVAGLTDALDGLIARRAHQRRSGDRQEPAVGAASLLDRCDVRARDRQGATRVRTALENARRSRGT